MPSERGSAGSDRPLPKLVRIVVTTPLHRLAAWRSLRRVSPLWTVAVALALAVVLLPIASILVIASTPSGDSLGHLVRNVLPASILDTALLLVGVGVTTAIAGAGTAWLITMYRFPGRGVLDRMLVLPLAIPTYIVAYAHVELLEFAGPLQSALRAWFGWRTRQDYWFPDIRSVGGAVLVLSSVLYPYVYLAARASFVQQSASALEVARTLGRTPLGALLEVGLPLARPALMAGVALALMETLNDLGAVQHLGVRSLTASVYDTWLQRSSLSGAAQIATLMLVVVLALFIAERRARGDRRFHHARGSHRALPFDTLTGRRAAAATIACTVPVLLGFVMPVLVLLYQAAFGGAEWSVLPLAEAARNSVGLAGLAALVTVMLALLLAYARRVAPNGFTRPAVMIAGLGYAMPGTILALGLLVSLTTFDNWLDGHMRAWFGVATGLLLSGSVVVALLAYVCRFLGVALGSLEAGLEAISPNLDAAARTLGETAISTLRRVHLPILVPALGAAALLVFVDTMKELPATLLLRPFGFPTLATHIYEMASLERFEDVAPGALAIVLVGLIPVLVLHRAIAGGRAGGGAGD